MQEIDTAFDYIPDESNDSVIYTKEPINLINRIKRSIFSYNISFFIPFYFDNL